jgi:hypothetical protein
MMRSSGNRYWVRDDTKGGMVVVICKCVMTCHFYLNPFWVTSQQTDTFSLINTFWLARRPTQSIGMLSYTFLRSTGKEDIIVPMVTSIPSWFSYIFNWIIWIPFILNNHCIVLWTFCIFLTYLSLLFDYYFLWRIICWTFCVLCL